MSDYSHLKLLITYFNLSIWCYTQLAHGIKSTPSQSTKNEKKQEHKFKRHSGPTNEQSVLPSRGVRFSGELLSAAIATLPEIISNNTTPNAYTSSFGETSP